ncbi:MAG: 50S ribosomal protein L24 [Syntrophobacterales bacterium]|nr:50S ribosomal protein L24 [Syntrophobacterales bacterium]
MGFKKGDLVKVTTGKDKGKEGKVLQLIKKKNRLLVEKVNMLKQHKKPDAKGKGGILEKEGPVHISNVMLVCSKCNKAVRYGVRALDDNKKVRYCKKCNEILDA